MFEFGGRGEDGGVDFVEGDLGGAAAAGGWAPGYVAVGVELVEGRGEGGVGFRGWGCVGEGAEGADGHNGCCGEVHRLLVSGRRWLGAGWK